MKHSRSEAGYTLVLTLGIFVLFMVLGFSLMTLTMSGVKKNESRESNVQAQDLAVKGLDYILKEIDYKMMEVSIQSKLANNTLKQIGPLKDGLSASDYLAKLETVLSSYSCSTASNLANTSTGKASYCIESYENKATNNPYKKIVFFKSIGQVNDKEKSVVSKVELGTLFNSEAFNYTLTTYQKDGVSYDPSSSLGNIELHGGLSITGDIHSANNIIISDKSHFKTSNFESVYPTFNKDISTASIWEVKNGTLQKNNAHNGAIVQNTLPNSVTNKVTTTAGKDFDVNFNIDEAINAHAFKHGDPGVSVTKTQYGNVAGKNYALAIEYIGVKYDGFTGSRLEGNGAKTVLEAPVGSTPFNYNWFINHENNFKAVAFPRNLNLKYGVSDLTNPKLNVSDYAYIGGDLTLGLNYKDETNINLENYLFTDVLGLITGIEEGLNIETEVTLNGIFYVNDDLHISMARLKGDAIIYVRNNANIMFSEINGNITIIAGGEVNIGYIANNHNDFSKTPAYFDSKNRSIWNGHIHSDKKVSLIGASSYLTINGSISAPEIYATSTKGRAHANCQRFLDEMERKKFTNPKGLPYYNCFETKANQAKSTVDFKYAPLKVLGIPLGYIPIENYPIKPRLEINYSEDPKIQFMRLMKVFSLDKPNIISREN